MFYLEYQNIVREIEHFSRLCIAYQFVLAEETKVHTADTLKEAQTKIGKIQESLAENEKKAKELQKEIAELEEERNKVRCTCLKVLIVGIIWAGNYFSR